ncbi:(d)CMP kinase [Defluviitalea raffinosedens]|jgi:cytidylate kinase|uniref:Cytidylate kinase n=1 Tax=Defluviitalea raffinosedens TaxID=1450156 RepID=A0A7C8LFJ0_9FIRM|nr:(d)CMP kinase [Defluviitalea raffinosedens]KAE9629852.1 (d)CMP kinase [Defluviitalea raffinosedens]MBM7686652.1 cytidylate kinase [Defluviitalea raffinosedens]HHW67865.1 (d)CMP kinase [Candidatus Epulonipiscium sp.]
MKYFSIAIDGPAGAGKSTIAKMIAKKLNIIYVDTGAMYRTVALYCIKHGIQCTDKDNVEKILNQIEIKILYKDHTQRIFLNDEDVSDIIRTQEISQGASDVATIQAVRVKMVELQRNLAKSASVVMDGRDIGTYVLPNADLKIFLTASVEERASRRYKELTQKGIECSLSKIKEEIEARDKNDTCRECSPLRKAEDAVEVDTTGKTIQEVVDQIISLIPKQYDINNDDTI